MPQVRTRRSVCVRLKSDPERYQNTSAHLSDRCDTKVTLKVANLALLGQYGHPGAEVNPLIANGFCDSVQEMKFRVLRS